MGETQHAFATSSMEPGIPAKDRSFKPFGKRDAGEPDGPFLDGPEPRRQPPGTEKGLGHKEKEPHSQREAVIRPQQAGKIDFKSLHSRGPFPGDDPWGAFRGSPRSPTGRSRARERSRRPGKGEQRPGHQQLYRLAISSVRPGPTIGIAYPQQKVTPLKKAEAAPGGAASGGYRLHAPEREGALPQGDLAFAARCFPEASASLLSGGHYTSSATGPRPNPATKAPPPLGIPHEGPGPNGQLHYLDNGSLPGAKSDGPPAHKPGPLSFPFTPFPPMEPFSGEEPTGEYVGLSVAAPGTAGPSPHGAFAFHASSREWKADFPPAPAAAAWPPAVPPGQTHGPPPGYQARKEPPSAPNGAISPPGAMDPNSSTFQGRPGLFPSGKQPPYLKEGPAAPRTLDPGSALRSTAPPAPLPHVHFQNKACADVAPVAPDPFEQSLPSAPAAHPQLLPPYQSQASRRPPGPPEEGASAFLSPLGSQLSFGGPLRPEAWQPPRKPWQPHPLVSAPPGQSRIELPRKLPFPQAGAAEWGGGGKAVQRSPLDCAGGRAPLAGEGAVPREPRSSAAVFCFEGAKEAEGPRGKALFFGLGSAAVASSSSHLPAIPVLAPSPSESPVPSPALQAPSSSSSSSSTGSSLSSTSSSPSAPEDGPPPLDTPTFLHPPCRPRSSRRPFLAPPACPSPPHKALLLSHGGPAKQEPLYKPLPGPLPNGCPEGPEAEPPPPPYASHHFLASSLSGANLDQLDVFLTCKQCDQNFSTLASFLEHRQFCGPHLGLPSQAREAPPSSEGRRPPGAPGKHPPGPPGPLLPPEPHPQLMSSGRAPEFLAEEDGKGGSGAAGHPLPLTASDLDIDEAKLDSLITEALNGLGYQSDNPEIDSSFIDVFADEELASVKVAGGGSGGGPCKPQEDGALGKKAAVTCGEAEESANAPSSCRDRPCRGNGRMSRKQSGPRESAAGWFHSKSGLETPGSPAVPASEGVDPEASGGEPFDPGARPKEARRGHGGSLLPRKQVAATTHPTKPPKAAAAAALPTSKPRRATAARGTPKEARKSRGGTWSKELIHKIVQQKNKLHKRQATGSHATAFSLLASRRVPERKDGPFGEYDYISESDDERVEEAKRHCQRKSASRASRRLRGGFGRRRPGRGARGKAQEPLWRLGPRRGLGEEPQRMEGRPARARRRSGRSSSSSCPSEGCSSEGSRGSPSTERPDSDTEKESEPRKRRRAKAPVGRGAAATQPPDVSPAAYASSEGAWLPMGGQPRAPKGPQGPGGFGEDHGHDGYQAGTMTAREADPGQPARHRHPHHFPACPGAVLEYPEEELPLPGEHHAAYTQGLVPRGLKVPTECLGPASCFNDSPAGLLSDGKGLPSHSNPAGTFSGAAPVAVPPSASFYLCPRELAEKHQPAGPYRADRGPPSPSPAPSPPLGFDTTSVFGQLPVVFDDTLYEDSRHGYVPFGCPGPPLGRALPFEQHYPSFFQEKPWALMEEGAALLPEDLPPFHSLPEEKPGTYPQPPSPTLPKRAPDYGVPFLSGLSEDELEIKRLVTELESQLQAGKLPALEETPGGDHHPTALGPGEERAGPPQEFLPLALGQERPGKGLLLTGGEFEPGGLLPTNAYSCDSADHEKAALEPKYGGPPDAWPCSVPFGPLEPTLRGPPASELILAGPFGTRGDQGRLYQNLSGEVAFGGLRDDDDARMGPDPCLPPMGYPEHLLHSPGLLPLAPAEAGQPPARRTPPTAPFLEAPPEEKAPNGGAALGSYRPPRPCLRPACGHGEAAAPEEPEGNLHSATASPASPEEEEEEEAAFPETRSPEVQASAEPSLPRGLPEAKENSGHAGDRAAVPLEPLGYSEEEEEEQRREAGPRAALEEKAPNPLQQLQLFVARTAKHNEEELLLPCFPAGLSVPHLEGRALGGPVQEKGPLGTVPGEEAADSPAPFTVEAREGAPQGPNPTTWFLEADPPGRCPGETGASPHNAAGAEARIPGRHEGATAQGPSGGEDCSKAEERNAPQGGHSPGGLNATAATASPREEAAPAGRVAEEWEEGHRTASLAFQSERQSPLSRGSLAEAEPGGPSAPLLEAPGPCQAARGEGACSEGRLRKGPPGPAAGFLPLEDRDLPQATGAPWATGPLSAEGQEPAGPCEEEAPAGSLPLDSPEDSQDDGDDTGAVADSGTGLSLSEEPGGAAASAGGQHSPLLTGGLSPQTGRSPIGKATRSPSACREEHWGLPPSPSLRHAGPPSPPAPEAPTCHGPSPRPSDPGATRLLGAGQPAEPQRERCTTPRVSPLENRERPPLEEHPKPLGDVNSGLCGARGAVTGPACGENRHPAEADPGLLAEGRAAQSKEVLPRNLAGKEKRKWPRPPALTGVPSRGIRGPATSRANFGETGAGGGAQANGRHFPEMAEDGLEGALQVQPRGGPALEEEEGSGGKGSQGGTPRCLELEGEVGEGPRDSAAKARQPRRRRRRGVPSVCDVCLTPFKSKTGLMRHKAVKHLKRNAASLLPAPGPAPPEATLEPSKAPLRRNRRPLAASEEAAWPPLPKAATGWPFPRSYGGPKREPSREIQQVASKLLGDFRANSPAMAHPLERPGSPSKESGPEGRRAGGGAEGPSSPKGATRTGRGRKAGAKEPERFAGKGKARKGKANVAPGHREATRGPPAEKEVPPLPSDGALESLDLAATPGPEGRATSCTSPREEPASGPPPPWPLGPLAPKGAAGRGPSPEETAGQRPVRDAQSGPERAGEPAGEGRPPSARDCWPKVGQEEAEQDGRLRSPPREEQEVHVAVEEPQPKGRAVEGREGLDDPGSPSVLQAAHGLGRGLQEVVPDRATESWGAEERPPKTEEPQGAGDAAADLPSLFDDDDDDATFSRLFPSEERFSARRKCTRVYGKGARKPRPVTEAKARLEGAPGPFAARTASHLGGTGSLRIAREDPCGYDTISLDDALLLHMCRGGSAGGSDAASGSLERMALPPEAAPLEEDWGGAVGLLGQKDPPGSPLCFSRQCSPGGAAEEVSAPLGPCQELPTGRSPVFEASPEGPGHGEGGPFEPRAGGQTPSPAFHTLEMEMLTTAKSDARDLCLRQAGGDPLGRVGGEAPFSLQPPPALPGRPAKLKPEEGKPGKGRGCVGVDPAPKAKERAHKCKVCFQWFLTLGELDLHKLSHNPSPPPTCYMCVQRRFSSREQLRDHLREKHARNKAGLWACGMCLKEIPEVWMYNEHLREHATQFARRGQAQKAALGFPGCLAEEGEEAAAVTRFLHSILRHRPPRKAARKGEAGERTHARGKESPGPKELPPAEAPARARPPAPSPDAPPSPGPAPRAGGPRRPAQEVHPECKDPSRDCHHCGKQFPKPFKLQRHLVVHSFQRVYLCPRCPTFYQETKELRHHLGQEHRHATATATAATPEGAELKHTTLYACELCADVMHVIKKSFICSACNYTFSKKEQFDRHMDKHRLGSRRTFRFRGVMRPGASLGREGARKAEGEGEAPPLPKRKKASPRQGLPVPTTHPTCPLAPAAHRTPPSDSLGGRSSPLSASPGSPPPATPPLSPGGGASRGLGLGPLHAGQWPKGHLRPEPLAPFSDPPGAGSDLDLASSASATPQAPPRPEKHSKEARGTAPVDSSVGPAMAPGPSLCLEEAPVSPVLEVRCASAEGTEWEVRGDPGPPPPPPPPLGETQPQDGVPQQPLLEATPHLLPPKAKAVSAAPSLPMKEAPSKPPLAHDPPSSRDKPPPVPCGGTEAPRSPSRLKPASGPARSEAGGGPAKPPPPDPARGHERYVAGGPKRKEHRSARKGSLPFRENLAQDDGGRRKKAGGPSDPARSHGARGHRRADWASGEGPALSPQRKGSLCPGLTPRLKVPGPGGQLRRLVPSPGLPRKGQGRPRGSGDRKAGQKQSPGGGRGLHPLAVKEPPLPGCAQRPRAAQGPKPPDLHNYRTAESQNNLLSQLFGQKLTSFKIPLRRDTSE